MAQLPDTQLSNAQVPDDQVRYTQLSDAHAESIESVDISGIRFAQLMDARLLAAVSEKQLNAISPIALAYVGDAVFELYVRSQLLIPAKRIRDYHQQVVNQVKAEQQSQHLDQLQPYLTDLEKDVIRRGRNATTGRNRRAKGQAYQKATGLEALIGFLYLSDATRLMSLLNRLDIGCGGDRLI